jgi:hypothetical protein
MSPSLSRGATCALLTALTLYAVTTTPLAAAEPSPDLAPDAPAAKPRVPVEDDPAFHAVLKAVARDYAGWSRADDSLRFVPLDCSPDTPYPLAPVRLSASEHADSHGRKLYFLYVNNNPYYPEQLSQGAAAPVGLSIVKQSWEAVVSAPSPAPTTAPQAAPDTAADRDTEGVARADAKGRRYLDTLVKDGVTYHVGQQRALFVMHRLDPATPNTDDGWVYGTLTPDGQTVTSSGRVASCMGCHASAPHGRLFGLPKALQLNP